MAANEQEGQPILVTGAAGYIGSVVCQHFASAGSAVVGVDCLLHGARPVLPLLANPMFRFERVDLTKPQQLKDVIDRWRPAAIVHLAAIVGDPACKKEPERAHLVNYAATMALADAAQNSGVRRFIFTSTCSNYGAGSDDAGLLNEEADLRPLSTYAETKVKAEQELLQGWQESGMSITVLRFATAHGLSSRMRFDLTVNEFTRDAVVGGSIDIYDAETWRPYCHVSDFGRAMEAVLTAPDRTVRGQVFNVGANSENFRKSDLADFAVSLNPVARVVGSKSGADRRNYRVDFVKIHQLLGFECRVTVPQSMRLIADALRTGLIDDPYAREWRNA